MGGLGDRMDAVTVVAGPAFHLDLAIGDVAVVGVGLSSLTVLGGEQGVGVELLPLAIEAGVELPVGPVRLGGTLVVTAERWSSVGITSGDGWRGGMGLSGRLAVPFLWFLEVWVRAGFDSFVDSYTFGYFGDIVAELTHWRWQAGFGLSVRIPVTGNS